MAFRTSPRTGGTFPTQYLVESFSETEGHVAFPSLDATTMIKVESNISVQTKDIYLLRYNSQLCFLLVKIMTDY